DAGPADPVGPQVLARGADDRLRQVVLRDDLTGLAPGDHPGLGLGTGLRWEERDPPSLQPVSGLDDRGTRGQKIEFDSLPGQEPEAWHGWQARAGQLHGGGPLGPGGHRCREVINYYRPLIRPEPQGRDHQRLKPGDSAVNNDGRLAR